jgi:hypothetical protein
MSPDEARERFSDAFEEGLEGEERARFDEALSADPALAAEYRAFCGAIKATRSLGRLESPRPSVDLLEGVQARIRKRSRGRFYRDRFAPQRGSQRLILPLIVTVLMLLLFGIAYAGLRYVGEIEQDEAPAIEP